MTPDTNSVPAGAFDARVLPQEGLVVVALRGEADMRAVEALDASFDAATDHPGAIITDLAGLTFLDSSGVRALVQAHSRIVSQGRRFGLACPPGGVVGQVLELTQLHRVMPIHPDRETAARALRG